MPRRLPPCCGRSSVGLHGRPGKHYAAEARAHPSADAYVKLGAGRAADGSRGREPFLVHEGGSAAAQGADARPAIPRPSPFWVDRRRPARLRRALGLARRSLRIGPGNAYAGDSPSTRWVELAVTRRRGGSAADARPPARPQLVLASLLHPRARRRTALARRALRQAHPVRRAGGGDTAWAYLYLGNLEFGRGRYAAAGRAYRMAERVDPGFATPGAAMARLAAARGDVEAGIRLLRPVVGPDPAARLCDRAGRHASAAGRPAAARSSC